MGRPTKLDDLVSKRVVDAVAMGLPRDTAAKLARISPATLYSWLAKGRAGEPGFTEFFERVKEAEARGEAELVNVIREAAPRQWQAAAWLLERRRPEAYARRDNAAMPDEDRVEEQSTDDLEVARSVVAALESRRVG